MCIVTAVVASDIILDTGDFAEELGHTGGVYLSHYIPLENRPRGKKAAPLWVEGFSTIFSVIHQIFEDGNIPTIDKLEHELTKLPKDKQKLIKAYGKQGAGIDHVLKALIYGAKDDWENDFQDAHCDGEEWLTLPTCKEHDLNWTLAEDALIE